MTRLASILVLLSLASCSSETVTECPRDLSANYQVASTGRDDSAAQRIRPSEQPAEPARASKTVSLPCRMMVANNNIYMLDRPWTGAKRGDKPYRAGTIFTGEKMAGEWVYVRDILTTGWIHKDNLRPLVR